MKKLLLSLLAVASVSAFAEGAYVGIQSDYVDNFGSSTTGQTQTSQVGYGVGLTAGYQFNKYVGAELGYTFLGLGNVKSSTAKGSSTAENTGTEANVWDAAAVIGYPMFNDKVVPFVKLGLASVFASSQAGQAVVGTTVQDVGGTKFAQYMGIVSGAGVAYAITPKIAANLHVEYVTSVTGEYAAATPLLAGAGVTYSF